MFLDANFYSCYKCDSCQMRVNHVNIIIHFLFVVLEKTNFLCFFKFSISKAIFNEKKNIFLDH